MYIKEISLDNFQSYWDRNQIEFGKGLNLFIGSIGAGKSKLFNAFQWCLYDRTYKTLEGWLSGQERTPIELVNRKKLFDTEVGSSFELKVQIVVVHNNLDYNITRLVKFKKLNEVDQTNAKESSNWEGWKKAMVKELLFS